MTRADRIPTLARNNPNEVYEHQLTWLGLRRSRPAGFQAPPDSANRLKGVAWRAVLTIITAKSEIQREKLIEAATTMDSVELQRHSKSLAREKPVPRLRGDPFKRLTEQADEFAAACTVFAKQAGDAKTTPARRKKLVKSMSAVRTAIKAAVRAAKE